MINLTLTSPPAAATWRASRYELASAAFGEPQVVRADPKAVWDRVDVFDLFEPSAGEQGPHVAFLGLKESDKPLGRFVHKYGLLGLFDETRFTLIPPTHAGPFALVAPDTVLDEWGRLRSIEPATEGKERLEALMQARLGSERPLRSVIQPDGLRFSSHRHTPFGPMDSLTAVAHTPALTWDEARDFYGVRAVLDAESASGVSFISTHEPLTAWELQIKDFPVPPCDAETLNARTSGATHYAVRDAESGRLRQSWRCASLLGAMYLMLYLDETTDEFEVEKCRAPGCPEYFRVESGDGRKETRMYCPPPPGRKESKCASRVSSAAHRERKRRES